MDTFLTVMLYILWVAAILVGIIGGAAMILEGGNRPSGVAGLAVGLMLTGALITVMINAGAFEDDIPPDGCYQIYRTQQVTPAGKGQVVITDDVHYQEIPCP